MHIRAELLLPSRGAHLQSRPLRGVPEGWRLQRQQHGRQGGGQRRAAHLRRLCGQGGGAGRPYALRNNQY